MALTLGIHIGHHTSCAVVRDGTLTAAVQLERISRRKHHVTSRLTNDLPIDRILADAGATIKDVDLIVTSFAAAAPGGIGLGRTLVAPDFSLFDPSDARHRSISHHLAHANCTFEASGWAKATVLVCDYAGSTTTDGQDYDLSFSEWERSLNVCTMPAETKTEWLSIYRAVAGESYELIERRFCVAHPVQDVFVYHVSGLYDNISNYVFQSDQAQGQLMALAASGTKHLGSAIDPGCLYQRTDGGEPVLRNDWQGGLPQTPDDDVKAVIAYRCQEATEAILTFFAKRARYLTGENDLCVSGGTFLNITANTAIWRACAGSAFFVPSAPHDAGIAVGCAYYGWRRLQPKAKPQPVRSDILGPVFSKTEVLDELNIYNYVIDVHLSDEEDIARLLEQGKIVARFSGRSEFGPRALGHRSLLADPRNATVKARLNSIKGRQPWRPVAPVIALDRIQHFFDGPPESPWMNMSYSVRPEFRDLLLALAHDDHSTRPQTVTAEQDPELYALVMAFERLSGLPILANTSLNRRGEPIVETPKEAVAMFLDKREIDCLVIEGYLVLRKATVNAQNRRFRLSSEAILTRSYRDNNEMLCLIYKDRVWNIEPTAFSLLERAGSEAVVIGEVCDARRKPSRSAKTLTELVERGVLVLE